MGIYCLPLQKKLLLDKKVIR